MEGHESEKTSAKTLVNKKIDSAALKHVFYIIFYCWVASSSAGGYVGPNRTKGGHT